MPKNTKKVNRNIVTQGYLQGGPHIVKFLEKEIGSDKAFEKEFNKLQAQYNELVDSGRFKDLSDDDLNNNKEFKKLGDKMNAIKAGYHKVYHPLKKYGKDMSDLYEANTIVDKKTVLKLMENSNFLSQNNVFTLKIAEWKSKTGANAIKKFTSMILKNDVKKFQYYSECLSHNSFKGLTMDKILECPLPRTREAKPIDREALKNKIEKLNEKLSYADATLHKDSKEFKAMKNAALALEEGLNNKLSDAEIGAQLESLQATSMKYVKAKGVGMQSSELGKERMDIALDLCSTATDYMDCYISDERKLAVADFEKDAVKKEISKDGTLNYTMDIDETKALVIDDDEMENANDENEMEMGNN